MTNRLAIVLAVILLCGIALDHWLDSGWTLFLLKRFTDLVDWLMFWR